MQTEDQVAAHYTRPGLEQAIVAALSQAGTDVDHLTPDDLRGADEMHMGWRRATVEFAEAMAFPPGAHVLDIGSGLGGPARHFGSVHQVEVTGIDLTADFAETANGLTRRCGLADRVSFRQGNALALPFADASFDGAYTIHAAMNIADKTTLFAEARRVLKPGARFGVYDVMRAGAAEIPYPMLWAQTAETSFVETPATYRRLLEAAGFAIVSERDRGDFVRAIAREMREKAARDGPPRVDLRALMGGRAERFAHSIRALEDGIIAPVEIIARAA